jgi:hypothetical protein
VEHLVENENDLTIFEEGGSDNISENVYETEIRFIAQIWQDHRGKSTVTAVPRIPPPWF